ncbi:uncharacterized protein LOC118477177, partial [Aplysia californica]|uniref:Uncharacterized protein LOC118477177 n=1 Tax=Aplysia californica TaxID=6500 RepID=A0ABM1VX93_APLCA
MLWFKLYHSRFTKMYKAREVDLDTHDDQSLNRVYVTDSHTLVLRSAEVKDTGTYFCRDMTSGKLPFKGRLSEKNVVRLFETDEKLRFFYHLDVLQKSKMKAKLIASPAGEEDPGSIPPPRDVVDLNLRVLTVWQEWGLCTLCGAAGTRRRVGQCVIRKLDHAKPASPWYLDAVLGSLDDGLPCRSSMLAGHQTISNMISRPDLLQQEECNVTCDAHMLMFKDILRQASKKQRVNAKIFSAEEGYPLTLACPGVAVSEPVTWLNGSKVVLTSDLPGGDPRVRTNENNELLISPLMTSDSGLYACVKSGYGVKILIHLKVKDVPEVPKMIL